MNCCCCCCYCNEGTLHWDGFDCLDCNISLFYNTFSNANKIFQIMCFKDNFQNIHENSSITIDYIANQTYFKYGHSNFTMDNIIYFKHPNELKDKLVASVIYLSYL